MYNPCKITCGCQSASMSVSSFQPSKIPLEQRIPKIALQRIMKMKMKMKMRRKMISKIWR